MTKTEVQYIIQKLQQRLDKAIEIKENTNKDAEESTKMYLQGGIDAIETIIQAFKEAKI